MPLPNGSCLVIALLVSLGVAACAGGSSASPKPAALAVTRGPVTQTDLQIAELLYTDAKRTPDGFYNEPARPDLAAATTFHLKNSDFDSAATRDFELCSDDFAQALGWSEAVARAGASYANLVETTATHQYFEIVRATPTAPIAMIRARVFKCAYVDRNNVDLNAANGSAGVLNERPLDAAALRQLAEYLWRFTMFNNFGHAVLISAASDLGASLRQSLYIANLEAVSSSNCDRIEIVELRHDADKATASLSRQLIPTWSFAARSVYGRVELCN
jgi:hypothetical protein